MRNNKHGTLYLVAGGYHRKRHLKPEPLFKAIMADTGIDSPRIAYVGAASCDSKDFLRWIGGLLKETGAGEVRLAPSVGPGARKKALAVLAGSDVVFVSGGDVYDGMANLRKARLVTDLRRAWRSGKPFIGLSAGSIMMGKAWVRWRNPGDDSTAKSFPCLGLAPIVCDTHEEDDDWPELKALLAVYRSAHTGYGIPSGAALKILPDGSMQSLFGRVGRISRNPPHATRRNKPRRTCKQIGK